MPKIFSLSNSSLFLIASFAFSCQKSTEDLRMKSLTKEEVQIQVKAIEAQVTPVLEDGLKLSLWGVDSLVYDPISIQVLDNGDLIYSRTNRQKDSEFDIRGHQDWEIRSISLQNIEDKRAFLRSELSPERSSENTWLADLNGDGSHDWRDMTVQKEEIYSLKDTDGDGYADQSQIIVQDFNDEVTDVAGAVMMGEDALFVGVGPDMWRLVDKNGDGLMDEKTSISHGYGIHIGFGAHGMSGLEMGPDGRVYWGIGDIGFNGTGPDGKEWKYPNRGVIARANPDGSDFEIYAMGVRNTHEFVFDAYNNLISVDNDGDHPGEKERLVYLTNGSDSGWRTNWQFGKYRDPDNNPYKVWMDEKLFLPRWEGQAAFITPCIQNYISGPTGMVYNPGTALGSKWKDSFFVVEFVGNPSQSGIHAFQLQQKGASFEMTKTERILSGVLPTGLDFGPDGALYIADWIDGWGTKNYGRIWKLEEENSDLKDIQAETEQKLKSDFKKLSSASLKKELYHPDLRIRRKAQFELAKRGNDGMEIFQEVIVDKSNQLARIHAIVGISQLARMDDMSHADALVPLLEDSDPEIKAQAAKWLGDIRYANASEKLIKNLSDANSRVQFFAAEALGRTEDSKAIQPLISLIESNNDEDAYIRHAATLALARIGKVEPLANLSNHPSKAVRLGAVIALRRLESPELARFLSDSDEFIVTEAARAIHDDFSVPEALPELAKLIGTTTFRNEPLVRRIISANQRIGNEENLTGLLQFINKADVPLALQEEAIAAVGTWSKPSLVDRVDGRYRGEVTREPALIREISKNDLVAQLNSKEPSIRLESAKALGKLKVLDADQALFTKLKNDPSSIVKVESLNSLKAMNSPILGQAITQAMKDSEQSVRVAGLSYLSETDLPKDQKVALLNEIINKRTIPEKQTALLTLGGLDGSGSLKEWNTILSDFESGKLPDGTWVELEEAIKSTDSNTLTERFTTILNAKANGEEWKKYSGALAEGSVRLGRGIFFENQTAQCIRCHAYDDMGGNAGPRLSGIANTLSREDLLIALVEPSKRLAPGYGTIALELNSGEKVSGMLMEDSEEAVVVKIGSEPERKIQKSEVKESKMAMSSMPPMGTLLSKRELRDLVSFLSTLTRE
ncbi:MAG: HEAT repeat domain-containing protein [Algoriphagus sp.]|uniref:HEAT repeat domain-containing protein n=1 Tax=Algoriphagus sp. TaxID=1872435 RepID=UPI0026075E76|nr:HEAT repeat domain-containing protein [Algoriphagus sp.]MDG1277208.1 HEAT repeat domain-containing protein [Algoriphagus sp.]